MLSQFLTLSGTRQISAKERAEAELKATVLGDVARRYNALVEAEDAVWSGRGAEDTTLALLTSIPEVRSGRSKVETEITVCVLHFCLITDSPRTSSRSRVRPAGVSMERSYRGR